MAQKPKKNFHLTLKQLGFHTVPGKPDEFMFEKKEEESSTNSTDSAKSMYNPVCPWKLKQWHVSLDGQQIETKKLEFFLDIETFHQQISEEVQNIFGQSTSSEFSINEDGSIWCVFEFQKNRNKGSDISFAGFRYQFYSQGSDFGVTTIDRFKLGDVPEDFLISCIGLLKSVINGKLNAEDTIMDTRALNTYEYIFSASSVAYQGLGAKRFLDDNEDIVAYEKRKAELFAINPILVNNELKFVVVDHWGTGEERGGGRRKLPIEVLETREMVKTHANLEEQLTALDFTKASFSLKQKLAKESTSLYLLRRGCLIPRFKDLGLTNDQLEKARKLEKDNLLFISTAISLCKQKKDHDQLLNMIVRFEEILTRKIRNADELSNFNYVLPKYLGDAWFSQDPDKAKAYYLKILERRGDAIEILDRLANLAHSVGKFEEEVKFLERLAATEEDPKISSEIYFRLLKVKAANTKEVNSAIKNGRECLKRNPKNLDAALLTAELLLTNDGAEEALEVLNASLEQFSTTEKNKKKLSKIEGRLGVIWLNSFQRIDLAKNHFNRALEMDAENIEVIDHLEQIVKENQDFDQLADILNRKLEAFQKSGSKKQVFEIKDSLIDLYVNKSKQYDKAFNLYLDLSEHAYINPTEINTLFDWDNPKADWHKLYDQLIGHRPKEVSDKELKSYHENLGNLCRLKLNNTQQAIDHFLSALDYGMIKEELFYFLTKQLEKNKDFKKLALVLSKRIDQMDGKSKSNLIKQLLNTPKGLSDEQKDEYAICLIELDPSDRKELFKRFNEYRANQDLSALESLAEQVVAKQHSDKNLDFWLELIIDSISSIQSGRKYKVIDHFLKCRLKVSIHPKKLLKEAIEIMKDSEDGQLLAFYAEKLIDHDLIPAIGFDQTIQLLNEDSAAMGKLLFLQSNAINSNETSAELAKKAANIFKSLENHVEEEQQCFARYCALTKCHPEEISYLRELCKETNQWTSFIKALEKQVELSNDENWNYLLLEEIGLIYKDKLNKPEKAIIAYEEAQKFTSDQKQIKIEIINIAHELGDTAKEKALLLDCLSDAKFADDLPIFEFVIDRLISDFSEDATVENKAREHIRDLKRINENDRAGSIADILIKRGVSSPDLRRHSFMGALARCDVDEIKSSWAPMTADLKTVDEVHEFLPWSKGELELSNAELTWEELLADTIRNPFLEQLPVAVTLEFKLQIGLTLFSSDQYGNLAMDYLNDVKKVNPQEIRVQMPLYLLVREYGNDEEIANCLTEIIPMILKNPSLIKQYPVTIESLYAELDRLHKDMQIESEMIAELKLAAGFESVPTKTRTKAGLSIVDQVPREEINSTFFETDWRATVLNMHATSENVGNLFDQPFSSAVEKHIALQATALLAGDISTLDKWQWIVWRNYKHYNYPLSGKERYPEDAVPEMLSSPVAKLISILTPAFVKIFRDLFTTNYLCRRLGLDKKKFSQYIKPMSWDDPLFLDNPLSLYRERIEKQKFQIYSLPGLGAELFYDGRNRTFFIDEEFYSTQPMSILFHRLYGLIWTIKLNYYVPLRIHPKTQALPMLHAFRDSVNDSGLSKIKNMFGFEQGSVSKAIASIDRQELVRLFERIGTVNESQITMLWTVMRQQVYQMQMAETLDIVGLFESICGRNLADEKNLKAGEIAQLSGYFSRLLEFATKIKI